MYVGDYWGAALHGANNDRTGWKKIVEKAIEESVFHSRKQYEKEMWGIANWLATHHNEPQVRCMRLHLCTRSV